MERLSVLSERTPTAGTVRAFHVGGVPVRLHFTFVLLVVFLVVSDLGHESSLNFGLYLLGLFASVLLHEMAHAGVASRLKIRTLEIVMFPIGGLSRMERRLRPSEELLVTLAGPATNLALAGAIFVYMAVAREAVNINLSELLQPSDGNVLQRLAFANLLLAGLNLMPAFPMDGGRVLRALLSFLRPEDEATRLAAWMGRMLAISMGLYGLVFSELLLVFFAFFVWLGAAQENAASIGRTLTHGIPVRAAMMTEFHRLGHGDTIRDAANLLLSSAQQDFPILHGDQVIGVLDRNGLMRALAREGPEAYVAGVMNRDFLALEPASDLAEMLPMLARTGRCALVMEGARLVGMLTTENLSEFLLLRRFGMEPAV
ncbi:MAG: site-2 protease family protein [Acidobacteriota bacterium]